MDQSESTNQSELLSAAEAAEYLGIKPPTLYAYVSRGLIESRAGSDARSRQYAREDLARLRARAGAPRGRRAFAASPAPSERAPATVLAPEGVLYRGRSAVELAEAGAPFEAVADRLFGAAHAPDRWAIAGLGASPRKLEAAGFAGAPPLYALIAVVPMLALRDAARFSSPRDADVERARSLVDRLAAFIGAGRGADAVYTAYRMNGVAARAATALGRDDEAAWRIVNALLVLAADAPDDDAPARIASEAGAAGADLYGCVLGALSAFAAPAFAGSFDAVEALFADAANGARAREAIADRLRRGERIPGSSASENGGAADFLLARATGIDTPGARAANAVAEAIHDAGHGPPSLVFACGAATHTLGLGPGSAAGLFALARCAGWIARALDARSQTPGRH